MRESKSANFKFWVVAVAALIVAAGSLAVLLPSARANARAESDRLTTAGTQVSGGEAEADFRLATWLNRRNQTAYVGMAQTQIAAGQSDLAVKTLEQAGQGSGTTSLRVRTLIELSRPTEAAAAATGLTGPAATQSDLVLAGLAYAFANRPADATALIPRLSSTEAATSVSRASSGKIPLAAELYVTGLLNSSSAILTSQPASYERNLLLSRILYARHTPSDLHQAAALLAAAVTTNPSSLEAHQLLANVYSDQGNSNGAAQQDGLITMLQAGRP